MKYIYNERLKYCDFCGKSEIDDFETTGELIPIKKYDEIEGLWSCDKCSDEPEPF